MPDASATAAEPIPNIKPQCGTRSLTVIRSTVPPPGRSSESHRSRTARTGASELDSGNDPRRLSRDDQRQRRVHAYARGTRPLCAGRVHGERTLYEHHYVRLTQVDGEPPDGAAGGIASYG